MVLKELNIFSNRISRMRTVFIGVLIRILFISLEPVSCLDLPVRVLLVRVLLVRVVQVRVLLVRVLLVPVLLVRVLLVHVLLVRVLLVRVLLVCVLLVRVLLVRVLLVPVLLVRVLPLQSSPVQSSPVQSSPVQSSPVPEIPYAFAKESGNFGRDQNGKVRFGFLRPEYSRSPLEMVHLFRLEYSLIREIGKGIKSGR